MSGAPKGSVARAARSASPSRSVRSGESRRRGPPPPSAPGQRLGPARDGHDRRRRPASASAARRPRPELAPVTQAMCPPRSMCGPSRCPHLLGGQVEVFVGEILRKPDIGGAGMPLHPFEPGDARRGLAIGFRALLGRALPGDDLHELVDRQAARVARTRGRQDVVRARRLVAEGHGRFLAEEQRAVAGQPVEPPVEVLGLHRQVLGRVIVGGRRHLLAVRRG
jgi:hypothetical protein